MPQFASTYNILIKPDEHEVHDPSNFMDNKVWTPPRVDWDYSRELQIEDVDIWEVLVQQTGGLGLYASYVPYAEFYLLTTGHDFKSDQFWIRGQVYNHRLWETFYGAGAQQRAYRRAKEIGLNLPVYQTWVDEKDMWLHNPNAEPAKKIFFPPTN